MHHRDGRIMVLIGWGNNETEFRIYDRRSIVTGQNSTNIKDTVKLYRAIGWKRKYQKHEENNTKI